MEPNSSQLDFAARRFIYDHALQGGSPPSRAEVATATGTSLEATDAALGRLASGRVLVLQPQTREILMAPPFSAIPTPFVVETARFHCYGNCIWDALGVAAMLHQNARVRTGCGDCGTAMDLHVDGGRIDGDGILHFAVPARDWWQDVVFS